MSLNVSKTAIVQNSKGLHLRPAGVLSQIAARYQSELTVTKDGLTVDARSILDLLTLVATQGSELVVQGAGDDAEEAVAAIVDFLTTDTADGEEA